MTKMGLKCFRLFEDLLGIGRILRDVTSYTIILILMIDLCINADKFRLFGS
jgi:hypothetical protein